MYLHVNERISTAPWTAASIRIVTCGAARKPGVARSDPEVDPGVRVEADFTGDHLLHFAAAGCVLDIGLPDSP